jgi:hypothetical protein
MIPEAVQALLTEVGQQVGLPVTRDPQQARAKVAQSGMCLTCSPPSGISRILGGGLVVGFPVHLVLPMPASITQVDRALTVLPAVAEALGQWSWVWDDAIPLGPDFHPGFSIDVELTVCEQEQ